MGLRITNEEEGGEGKLLFMCGVMFVLVGDCFFEGGGGGGGDGVFGMMDYNVGENATEGE